MFRGDYQRKCGRNSCHSGEELSGGVERQVRELLGKAVEGRKQVTDAESIVAEIQGGASDVQNAIDEIGR